MIETIKGKIKDSFLLQPELSFAMFTLVTIVLIHAMTFGVFKGLVSSLGLALSFLGALLVFFSIILGVVMSSSWKEYSFLGASEFDLLTAYSISARLIRTKGFRFALVYLFLFPVLWDKVQQSAEKFSGLLLSMWGAFLIVAIFSLLFLSLDWVGYLWRRAEWGLYDVEWRDSRFWYVRMRDITSLCEQSIRKGGFHWDATVILDSVKRVKEVKIFLLGSALCIVLDSHVDWFDSLVKRFGFSKRKVEREKYLDVERFVKSKWNAKVIQTSCMIVGAKETYNYFVGDIETLAGLSGWKELHWNEHIRQLQDAHDGWFPQTEDRLGAMPIPMSSSWVLNTLREFIKCAEKSMTLEKYVDFCCGIVEEWTGECMKNFPPEFFHPVLLQEIRQLFFNSIVRSEYGKEAILNQSYWSVVERIERSKECSKMFWRPSDEVDYRVGGRRPTPYLNEILIGEDKPLRAVWEIMLRSLSRYAVAAIIFARLCRCANNQGTCECGRLVKIAKRPPNSGKVRVDEEYFNDALRQCCEDDRSSYRWDSRAQHIVTEMKKVDIGSNYDEVIDIWGLDYLHYVHLLSEVENDFQYLVRLVCSNGNKPSSFLIKEWENAFDTFMASPFFTLDISSSESAHYRDARKSLDRICEAL